VRSEIRVKGALSLRALEKLLVQIIVVPDIVISTGLISLPFLDHAVETVQLGNVGMVGGGDNFTRLSVIAEGIVDSEAANG